MMISAAGRIASRAVSTVDGFSEPIFILSSPRSGSSHLHGLMHAAFACWGSPRENDPAWWWFFPYDSTGYTDAVSLHQFQRRTDAARFKTALVSGLVTQLGAVNALTYAARHLRGGARFLDKTVANAFHLEVLAHVFPDARYIYIVRDGRSTIASMIEGWLSGKFMKRRLPFPQDATVSYWTFPVPPGWEHIVARPLPEICAWSWMQHHRAIRRDLSRLELGSRLIVVRYEDLIDNKKQTLARLAHHLRFSWHPARVNRALELGASWTTVSAPKHEKWKESRGKEIESVLPIISDTMAELGYD